MLKTAKKKKSKSPSPVRHEVVVSVQSNLPAVVPTESELVEPMRANQKLTIPKTWITGPQLIRLTEKTPKTQIYERPGKGGGKWTYVTVSYVQRVLDYVFGWNWDFEIVEHGKEADHVWVLGRLTVRSSDGKHAITKTQFGRSEVKHKKDTKEYLDYGNDLKAASSDALKKCASMLGIARDIYSKNDYKAESGNTPRGDDEPVVQIAPKEEKEPQVLECHGYRKGGCPDGATITKAGYDFSMKVYGKPLCRNCAAKATPIKKK
jgi:hypothetical protein